VSHTRHPRPARKPGKPRRGFPCPVCGRAAAPPTSGEGWIVYDHPGGGQCRLFRKGIATPWGAKLPRWSHFHPMTTLGDRRGEWVVEGVIRCPDLPGEELVLLRRGVAPPRYKWEGSAAIRDRVMPFWRGVPPRGGRLCG